MSIQTKNIFIIFKTTIMAELKENIDKVREFHEVFGIAFEQQPQAVLSEKDYMLRFNLMKEENEEYLTACQAGDLTEIADALGDMMYILFGTIVRHGLQHKIEEVFTEIHRSNMSKLDENGNPIYREDGKILKSNLYFKPQIKEVLER
jgi:predicted HAD superfamily Cof-like phosphohydrolase